MQHKIDKRLNFIIYLEWHLLCRQMILNTMQWFRFKIVCLYLQTNFFFLYWHSFTLQIRTMRYVLWLLLSLLCVGSVFADLWWYTIDTYYVEMKLHEDASMDVVEQIDVNFSEPRHGIYREIPLQDTYKEYISLSKVSVDPDPLASETTSSESLTLQIGDKDVFLSWPKRYTIKYTVDNAIKAYSGWAELYRNVIGHERETSINNPVWSLELPKSYTPPSTGTFVVRWAKGEKREDTIVFKPIRDTIRGGTLGASVDTTKAWQVSKILTPRQWITIGMQFPADYFIFPPEYEKLFAWPTIGENIWSLITNQHWWTMVSRLLNNIRIYIFLIAIIWGNVKVYFPRDKRKSDRPITIQYTPPKNIEPSIVFNFWCKDFTSPKLFTALLYYRATQWWVVIRKTKSAWFLGFGISDEFHIVETSNAPQGASEVDRSLLQKFFGTFDTVNDDVKLNKNSHSSIKSLLISLHAHADSSWYSQKKKGRRWFLWARELTQSWSELFEHLRGYKEYLSKVEQPVLEKELQADPDFVNKILPRATLFWVESRLLKMVEEVLKSIKRYQSDDGSYLTYHTFNAMNSSFKTYSTPPRSSSSSGFSGWGWFSGWWWGGGWGGSW